jgi:Cu/Ag efflux pump CusA
MNLTEGRRSGPSDHRDPEAYPEVDTVLSQLVDPKDGTDPKLANNLEFLVRLKRPERWPEHVLAQDIVTRLNADLRKSQGSR